jgi:hypothetical protein
MKNVKSAKALALASQKYTSRYIQTTMPKYKIKLNTPNAQVPYK